MDADTRKFKPRGSRREEALIEETKWGACPPRALVCAPTRKPRASDARTEASGGSARSVDSLVRANLLPAEELVDGARKVAAAERTAVVVAQATPRSLWRGCPRRVRSPDHSRQRMAFTRIELAAVLGIIVVVGIGAVLPWMESAKKKAQLTAR